MKTTKKLMALMLSLVMMLALGVTAFATESGNTNTGTTYTITAPDTNHQYEIYQIFTGDLSNGVLSNVKWGKNGKGGTEGSSVSANVLDALTALSGDSVTNAAKLEEIEKYVNLTNPVATITKNRTYTAKAGYYLIKDADGSVSGLDSYTTYIVEVVGDTTITPKSAVPSFEKKLKDINDSTNTGYTEWQDSADYDIGDKIPFKLEGTVASNYDSYSTYYFAFHDQEETGLTFDKTSVKVYVDGQKITAGYDIKTKAENGLSDGCTFEVIFSNLKTINSVKAGSKIRVEYTSELNANAVIGAEGNVNKGKLEFSNNPNTDQGESRGETPWDNVIVFTYQLVVNKVANSQSGNPLPGAAFELKKKNSEGNYVTVALVNATKEQDGSYKLIDDQKTRFEWSRIDDGDYQLVEVITPAGYNTIDPIEFTVNADHTIEWDGTNRNRVLTSLNGTKASGGDIIFTANANKTELESKVVNQSGSSLPSTGGMGTTIFYVVGTILVLAAVVLLITKKRMHADK